MCGDTLKPEGPSKKFAIYNVSAKKIKKKLKKKYILRFSLSPFFFLLVSSPFPFTFFPSLFFSFAPLKTYFLSLHSFQVITKEVHHLTKCLEFANQVIQLHPPK